MVKRQPSSGNLLPKRSVPFDHGITAAFLLIFGCFGLALGGTMTGLSYGYEKRDGFTSVAEAYNLRCDIAGPVILASGGIGVLLALILISVFDVCSQPEWSSCEAAPSVPSVSHGVEIHMDGNNSTAGGRRSY
ncbi:hypothetical protein GHT06_009824 [Daphnia sinensis]|uniref:Uncharacterized protein n=1 Tax=Daphnia sinensis TaxID=1820382 RepID=A0AAD5Q425_9CRUS|nr:hypothetical protein GHT06_009824 [Daphnia sinensis]